jgi:hypothetical protein
MEMRVDIIFVSKNDLNPSLGKKCQDLIISGRPALC